MSPAIAAAPIKAATDLVWTLPAPPVLPEGLAAACPLADPPLAVFDGVAVGVAPLT